MTRYTALILLALGLGASGAWAQRAGVKIDDINTDDETSIVIKKGASAAAASSQCNFEVVSGDADISGDPEYGRKEAYGSWKLACDAWKKELRELNTSNQIVTMACSSPVQSKENNQFVYRSKGSYKIKVRSFSDSKR
jgi:hypothetical protein